MPITRESDLYAPIKAHLEAQGFTVRAEVGKCDVAALKDDTLIMLEMKLAFGLPVLYQALERLSSCDYVYVAVGVPDGNKARANWDAQVPDAVRLCRMLGVGLLSVRDGLVVVHADPGIYQPRKQPKKRAKMLSELRNRSGDHNLAGTTKRPRVTVYRENALRCAQALARAEQRKPSDVRDETGVTNASNILRDNVYNWFEKVDRGIYAITPAGLDALELYADVVAAQRRLKLEAEMADMAREATSDFAAAAWATLASF